MIPLPEAQQLISQQAGSFGKEIVLLEEAVGRVLQEPVIADRDYPPFNRATMDGIAIAIADWDEGIRSFDLVETVFAGKAATQSLRKGACYKIMTGAAVPVDADTVIRREDVVETNGQLSIQVSEVYKGQNIASKGSDIQQGTVVADTGHLIKAGTITTLASLGYDEVKVASLPSVAIITTGDEVMPVDSVINEVQIRNSNQHLLKALLLQWKIKPAATHAKDDMAELLQTINRHKRNDILILSGAVSAGDADFVPEVLIKAGAEKIFHKVAIRPGKPIWFGRFSNGPVVFALPGNPFSTFVTFKLFVEEYLMACLGLPQRKTLQLPFNGTRIKKTNLTEFFPVLIDGCPAAASAVGFNTSGDITALVNADGIAMQPDTKMEMMKGELVNCFMV